MKFKSLLISALAMSSVQAFAATYYVTPDGAGSRDGSSFENAMGVAEFRTKAAANQNGDIYMFAGGLYNLSESTVIFKTATGATLIGNANGDRTIFSGDKDGNNNPDATDAARMVRFQANTVNGNSANAIVIENIDFTCVYTNADSDDSNMAALAIDNSGDVLVKNCHFYNNWAQGSRGGAAAFLNRSTVKFVDCVFRNNSANYRGGAIRIYSNHAEKGIITLENCVVKDNKNYHNLGGAIFMGHGNSLNIINSTITGNSAVSDGAAIYFNGYDANQHRELRIVNSTIANNNTTSSDDAQIVSTQTAHLAIANSIITSDEAMAAFKFKGAEANEAFALTSGGFNYVGKIIDGVEKEIAWTDTDNHGEECDYINIFGSNKLNDDNVIKPTKFYLGATGAQVGEAVGSWGLPAGLDLTVDQLGNAREGDMTPGAYAVKKESLTSGISDITEDAGDARLVALGDGVYAIEGAEGSVAVYSMSGSMVMNADAAEINLSGLMKGVYVMKLGNKIFKVIR